MTLSTALDNTTNGTYALFHPSYQHVVANSHGIFAIYNSADNGNHDPATWRLKRSTNNGVSWTTVRDSSVAGDPQYGISPALETDENDNVFVIANYLPQAGETFKATKLYKYSPSDGYTTPTITTLADNYASGKFTTFLDQGRHWIWICHWSDHSTTKNLLAIDYSGTIQYQKNIFPNYSADWTPTSNASTDLHAASAHYQSLWVNSDGTVFLAWSGLAFQSPATSFYDVRLIYSTSTAAQFQAGTETWMGPQSGVNGTPSTRSMPICVDDSGAQNRLAYPICKLSDQTEFIPATDPGYWNGTSGKFNWNRIEHMAFNNGAVHFYYNAEDQGDARVNDHRSYARFRMATHDVADSERNSPNFQASTGEKVGYGNGNFVQDTTLASRLYFVGVTFLNPNSKILVLKSDDGGLTWSVYATGPTMTGIGSDGLLNCGAFRWVMTDGTIHGLVGYANSPNTVYHFRVTPN